MKNHNIVVSWPIIIRKNYILKCPPKRQVARSPLVNQRLVLALFMHTFMSSKVPLYWLSCCLSCRNGRLPRFRAGLMEATLSWISPTTRWWYVERTYRQWLGSERNKKSPESSPFSFITPITIFVRMTFLYYICVSGVCVRIDLRPKLLASEFKSFQFNCQVLISLVSTIIVNSRVKRLTERRTLWSSGFPYCSQHIVYICMVRWWDYIKVVIDSELSNILFTFFKMGSILLVYRFFYCHKIFYIFNTCLSTYLKTNKINPNNDCFKSI